MFLKIIIIIIIHHDDYLPKLETRYGPASVQYTKIRNKNSSFNPTHYGMNPIVSLRPEMDKDKEEKQYCKNPYAITYIAEDP